MHSTIAKHKKPLHHSTSLINSVEDAAETPDGRDPAEADNAGEVDVNEDSDEVEDMFSDDQVSEE